MSAWAVRLLLALPVLVLVTLTFPDDAEAKFWRIRISGGDLPHAILLGEYGNELGQTINITKKGMDIRVAEAERPYLVECVDAKTLRTFISQCDNAGWYYPRTDDTTPGRPLLVPFETIVKGDRLLLPEGGQFRLPLYAATLDRYILLAREGLIGESPSRFEVISKAGRFHGGKVELFVGPEQRVDLTAQHGDQLWELLELVDPADRPELRTSVQTPDVYLQELRLGLRVPPPIYGEESYHLSIRSGDDSITFSYYPPKGTRPAFIGGMSDTPVYRIPRELDTMLQAALGVDANDGRGAALWLWSLVSGMGGVAVGIVATLVLRRRRTSGQRVLA